MAFTFNPFSSFPDSVRNRSNWGSFWDTTIQTADNINTPKSITFNSTDLASEGIEIVSGSRLTFSRGGVYSIIYSIQFTNEDNKIHDVDIWLRKNDSGNSGNLEDTNSRFTVPGSHAGGDGHLIATVNYVYKVEANDYLELIWSTPNQLVNIETIPASLSSPARPRTPSIILTATQVA